jgi:hypothetical protein
MLATSKRVYTVTKMGDKNFVKWGPEMDADNKSNWLAYTTCKTCATYMCSCF